MQEDHAKGQAAFESENRCLSVKYRRATDRLRELQGRNNAIKTAACIKQTEASYFDARNKLGDETTGISQGRVSSTIIMFHYKPVC